MKRINQRQQQKNFEAEARNAAYQGLTVKDRIALVKSRIKSKGGESKRELARLSRLK